MPRRHRPVRGRGPGAGRAGPGDRAGDPGRGAGDPPLRGGWARREEGSDGGWMVRSVSGSAATKRYRCPGCHHEIGPGTPHVVAWPADEPQGSAERRHWHSDCWRRRRR